jgi:membrane-associated phospholipid phosphatase
MVDSNAFIAWRLFNLNWIPIAAMGGVLLLGGAFWGFSIEPVDLAIPVGIAVALALTAYLYAFAKADRADPKLIFPLGTISQLLLVVTVMGPLTYVAGAANWPLQDHTLLAIDRALGMDPELIARYVNDHDWLAGLLVRGYGLIKWPLLGIPIVLTLTSRFVRLQLFVFAFSLALIVTVAISAFIPAIGTYYGLNIAPSQFPSLDASLYAAQLRDIVALREGSLRHLELFRLVGIVSFPSFHVASAVLYMWALWPVRGIGGLAVALNLLMIAATPVTGAHYMIDVFGGIALAAISIFAGKYFMDALAPSQSKAHDTQPASALSPAATVDLPA